MMGLNVKESLVVLKGPERGTFLFPREKLKREREKYIITNLNVKSLVKLWKFSNNSHILRLQTFVWSSLTSGSSSFSVKPSLFFCFWGLELWSSMLMATASLLESSTFSPSSNSVRQRSEDKNISHDKMTVLDWHKFFICIALSIFESTYLGIRKDL